MKRLKEILGNIVQDLCNIVLEGVKLADYKGVTDDYLCSGTLPAWPDLALHFHHHLAIIFIPPVIVSDIIFC